MTVVDDLNLKSTWPHRAWVTAGFTTVFVSLANSITNSQSWFEPTLAGLVGYLVADIVAGIFHWAVDNYGSPSTPIFGFYIKSFQTHHELPWRITKREFANLIYPAARVVALGLVPLNLMCHDSALHGFVAVLSIFLMLSIYIHVLAHKPNSELPFLVIRLQNCGLLLPKGQHVFHHKAPFDTYYCVLTGIWNPTLDKHKVFQRLEILIFSAFGVRPRSWSDPKSDKNQTEPSQTLT